MGAVACNYFDGGFGIAEHRCRQRHVNLHERRLERSCPLAHLGKELAGAVVVAGPEQQHVHPSVEFETESLDVFNDPVTDA